jgi:hypothetical protein
LDVTEALTYSVDIVQDAVLSLMPSEITAEYFSLDPLEVGVSAHRTIAAEILPPLTSNLPYLVGIVEDVTFSGQVREALASRGMPVMQIVIGKPKLWYKMPGNSASSGQTGPLFFFPVSIV